MNTWRQEWEKSRRERLSSCSSLRLLTPSELEQFKRDTVEDSRKARIAVRENPGIQRAIRKAIEMVPLPKAKAGKY